MLKVYAWVALVTLAALPESVAAQGETVANSPIPVPADRSAVGEPAVADGLIPKAAGADQLGDRPTSTGILNLADVRVVYMPPPSQYQPESSPDSPSPAQPVQIACLIRSDGSMQDCAVNSGVQHDPNVAELALGDVSQFIVGPTARNGESVAGQTLVMTCQFQPVNDGERQSLASN
jgi:hypothetical protein